MFRFLYPIYLRSSNTPSYSPLELAIMRMQFDMVKMLFEDMAVECYPAEEFHLSMSVPMSLAIQTNQLHLVEYFVERGFNFNINLDLMFPPLVPFVDLAFTTRSPLMIDLVVQNMNLENLISFQNRAHPSFFKPFFPVIDHAIECILTVQRDVMSGSIFLFGESAHLVHMSCLADEKLILAEKKDKVQNSISLKLMGIETMLEILSRFSGKEENAYENFFHEEGIEQNINDIESSLCKIMAYDEQAIELKTHEGYIDSFLKEIPNGNYVFSNVSSYVIHLETKFQVEKFLRTLGHM